MQQKKISLFDLNLEPFNYNKNMSLPTYGIMSVTNRCQLECPYCFHKQSQEDMDFQTADMAVRYLLSNAAQTKKQPGITFFGGEPLLCFESIIKPLVEKYKDSLTWSITTNGLLLNNEIIDFCDKYNIDILLSIDGCKEVQDFQRPLKNNSSFDILKKNIPYLLFKKPNTIFRSTITHYSLNFLEKNIETAQELGFKYITLVPNLFEEWDEKDYKKWEIFFENESIKVMQHILWCEPFNYILNNIIQGVQTIYNNENTFNLISPVHSCGMGCDGIGISIDGSLHPCQEENWKKEIESIGNIYTGISYIEHEQYLLNIYNLWINYLKNIDALPGSLNFKLFYATSYCSTRIKELKNFNNTQTYFLRVIHKSCTSLFYNFNLNLNPMAEALFQLEEK